MRIVQNFISAVQKPDSNYLKNTDMEEIINK